MLNYYRLLHLDEITYPPSPPITFMLGVSCEISKDMKTNANQPNNNTPTPINYFIATCSSGKYQKLSKKKVTGQNSNCIRT